jgi:hypothetical protein
MAKLSEYIGSVVASLTSARVMSDLQTIKVAEEYAKHDLLKHFSVPRMKLDHVELTIPVALENVEEIDKPIYEPIDNRSFNTIAYRELIHSFGLKSLSRDLSTKVQSYISKKTQSLEQSIQITSNTEPLKLYSHELANYVENEIRSQKILPDDKLAKIDINLIYDSLNKTLEKEIRIREQKKILENLNVIVESHLLKEHKSETITYIKLQISEDGLEWNHSENSEGQKESRLLPE